MEDKQKFLSLAEAAALTPYSSSYLSFLARKGKLRSIKDGDTWFTTREWVLDYLSFTGEQSAKKAKKQTVSQENGYISSAQAERLFPYSSSYFSLRIRQGKLKGKKVGKKWFTTAEWINEYIAAYGEKEKYPVIPAITPVEVKEIPPAIKAAFKFPAFSWLQSASIGLTMLTALIVAGPPKLVAHWVLQPIALAYSAAANIILGDSAGQVAGETIKSQ